MEWGPERYGPFFSTIGAPAFVAIAIGVTACYYERLPKLRRRLRFVVHALVAGVFGTLVAVWAHFVPCLYLVCDGGYYDDKSFRVALSWALGPIAASICAAGLARLQHGSKSVAPEIPVTIGEVVAVQIESV
jgi:hypothetical protein